MADAPIGELIRTADAGTFDAASALFAALYRELHGIAERELHRGGAELTLGTTTLLREAYWNSQLFRGSLCRAELGSRTVAAGSEPIAGGRNGCIV